MVHHIQTKIWFPYNNTNNYDMVAINKWTLKRDKVLKNSMLNVSYIVTILSMLGKMLST
jgi:hypothetical protein